MSSAQRPASQSADAALEDQFQSRACRARPSISFYVAQLFTFKHVVVIGLGGQNMINNSGQFFGNQILR